MTAPLIHLDTNFLILSAQPGNPAGDVLRRWRDEGVQLAVSAMAWAEFRCGPASPALIKIWEALLSKRIVPVDREMADLAGDLFNRTGRRSRSLPDCLIAACAMRSRASLATLNGADFEPLLPFGLMLA